jgi:hypothetical protein
MVGFMCNDITLTNSLGELGLHIAVGEKGLYNLSTSLCCLSSFIQFCDSKGGRKGPGSHSPPSETCDELTKHII